MLSTRTITLVTFTLAAAITRLLPHPPNVTPIAAMALFGGVQFGDRRVAFAVPLSAMLLSDVLLGFWPHPVMPFVYGSFAAIVGLGRAIRGRRSAIPIAAAALAGSILFFVLTNLGDWLVGALYPRTWEGLLACYVAAIPFFGRTVAGDALYAGLLFGGFALAERRFVLPRDTARLERAGSGAGSP